MPSPWGWTRWPPSSWAASLTVWGSRSSWETAVLSALFAPLVFLGGFKLALLGMVLWGIGMGSLESIIKAALAEMVPRDRRATGFGLFNAGFGVFWLLGSALMGFLYDFSLGALVAFSVTAQLLAIPFFLAVSKKVCLQPR